MKAKYRTQITSQKGAITVASYHHTEADAFYHAKRHQAFEDANRHGAGGTIVVLRDVREGWVLVEPNEYGLGDLPFCEGSADPIDRLGAYVGEEVVCSECSRILISEDSGFDSPEVPPHRGTPTRKASVAK